MKALKEMTAKEAVRAAKELSGLTVKQIADGLGVKVSVVKRYLKEDDPYWPSLKTLPRLCVLLGNDLLLDWAGTQSGWKTESREDAMLVSLSKATEILEELRLFVGKTETPTCREEKGMAAAPDEAALECERIRAFLPKEGGCDGKKRFWCPLWKFWKRCFFKSRRGQR